MIQRTLHKIIEKQLFKGKTLLIIGPRQVGKTTLIQNILHQREHLFLDGDDPTIRNLMTNPNKKDLETLLGNHTIIFIDEAQRIENIGITMKIIHDQFKGKQLIASGSSAFELKNIMSEPLTGRKKQYNLFPISFEEYEQSEGYVSSISDIENRLIYGFYPDVINSKGNEKELLNELVDSYLFKDILAFSNIKKPDVLEKILRALAFQVGSEVSYNEIAQLVGVDKNTVSNYINILELSYVIYSLPSFSRNLRNEIKKNKKIYFYDNGIRNAIVQNYNPLELRNDVGALWENFLISERLKHNHYHQHYCNTYFWRTKQQQEVDFLEEYNGKIYGYEFKWNTKNKVSTPKSFETTYDTKIRVITKDNFREFVCNSQ